MIVDIEEWKLFLISKSLHWNHLWVHSWKATKAIKLNWDKFISIFLTILEKIHNKIFFFLISLRMKDN